MVMPRHMCICLCVGVKWMQTIALSTSHVVGTLLKRPTHLDSMREIGCSIYIQTVWDKQIDHNKYSTFAPLTSNPSKQIPPPPSQCYVVKPPLATGVCLQYLSQMQLVAVNRTLFSCQWTQYASLYYVREWVLIGTVNKGHVGVVLPDRFYVGRHNKLSNIFFFILNKTTEWDLAQNFA